MYGYISYGFSKNFGRLILVFRLYPNYLILTKHPLTLVYLSFSFFIINLIVKSEGGEIYTLIVAIENTKIY